MERCLNWRGYCSADTSGITSARRPYRVKVQTFEELFPLQNGAARESGHGIVMTLDTNSAIGRMLLSVASAQTCPDIVIACPLRRAWIPSSAAS